MWNIDLVIVWKISKLQIARWGGDEAPKYVRVGVVPMHNNIGILVVWFGLSVGR